MSSKQMREIISIVESSNYIAENSSKLFEKSFEEEFIKKGFDISLLENARIDWLRANKLQDLEQFTNSNLQTSEEVLEYIVSKDPTKNKQYSQWLVKILSSKNSIMDELLHIDDYISDYNDLVRRNKIKSEYKDINKIQSFKELKEIVASESKEARLEDDRKHAYENSEILRDDGEWLIVIPRTELASQYFGRDSRLCTAGGYEFGQHAHNSCFFNRYSSGDIIIFINKQSDDLEDSYQYATSNGEFTDFDNNHEPKISLDDLIELLPEDSKYRDKIDSVGVDSIIDDAHYISDYSELQGIEINDVRYDNGQFVAIIQLTPSDIEDEYGFIETIQSGDSIDFYGNFSNSISSFDIGNIDSEVDEELYNLILSNKHIRELVDEEFLINIGRYKKTQNLLTHLEDTEIYGELEASIIRAIEYSLEVGSESEAYDDLNKAIHEYIEGILNNVTETATVHLNGYNSEIPLWKLLSEFGYIEIVIREHNGETFRTHLQNIFDESVNFSFSEPYNGWYGSDDSVIIEEFLVQYNDIIRDDKYAIS